MHLYAEPTCKTKSYMEILHVLKNKIQQSKF